MFKRSNFSKFTLILELQIFTACTNESHCILIFLNSNRLFLLYVPLFRLESSEIWTKVKYFIR
jgi:hypothetical protein